MFPRGFIWGIDRDALWRSSPLDTTLGDRRDEKKSSESLPSWFWVGWEGPVNSIQGTGKDFGNFSQKYSHQLLRKWRLPAGGSGLAAKCAVNYSLSDLRQKLPFCPWQNSFIRKLLMSIVAGLTCYHRRAETKSTSCEAQRWRLYICLDFSETGRTCI